VPIDQLIKMRSAMLLKVAAATTAAVAVTASASFAQFGAPSGGIPGGAAQVRKILDKVKSLGIVDGKAIKGKTKEACAMLSKADKLLSTFDDKDLKKTAAEIKKILECK
tara:strand:+ start:827 stop:1153 length:327 start_codon:yes stop_codon:yes gene_type:complete